MWHLAACKISVSLSFWNRIKNEMSFYRVSELILIVLIPYNIYLLNLSWTIKRQ